MRFCLLEALLFYSVRSSLLTKSLPTETSGLTSDPLKYKLIQYHLQVLDSQYSSPKHVISNKFQFYLISLIFGADCVILLACLAFQDVGTFYTLTKKITLSWYRWPSILCTVCIFIFVVNNL